MNDAMKCSMCHSKSSLIYYNNNLICPECWRQIVHVTETLDDAAEGDVDTAPTQLPDTGRGGGGEESVNIEDLSFKEMVDIMLRNSGIEPTRQIHLIIDWAFYHGYEKALDDVKKKQHEHGQH